MRVSLLLCVFGIFCLFIKASYATDLILECAVTLKQENGAHFDFLERYEITFKTSHVDRYENWGSGWKPGASFKFFYADKSRIVLAHDYRFEAFINRRTGQLYDKNYETRDLRIGTCLPAAPPGAKF